MTKALTVVTHTQGNRPELLERCKASVAAALPPGAEHIVIPCHENWGEARLAAMRMNEFVTFVDDDDTIHPMTLKYCLDAIQTHDAGLACTNEATVDINGTIMHEHKKAKFYGAIPVSPRTVHQLCLIRTKWVDPRALDLHNKYGMGVDWFIKASAALQGNAVHVPITGYYWTQHADSMTGRRGTAFHDKIGMMAIDIQTLWPNNGGRIPVYDIPTA